MATDDELDEVEAVLDAFEADAREAADRASVEGTDTERAIAHALKSQADALDGIHEELRGLHRAIDGLDSVSREIEGSADRASNALRSTARTAAGDYIREYGQALDHLERRADDVQATVAKVRDDMAEAGEVAAHAVEQAAIKASQDISRAGEDAADEIRGQSKRSSAMIAFLSVFGGLLAGIGAFYLFQLNKPIQNFVKTNGGFSLVLILTAVAIIVYIIICVALGKKKRW